MLDETIVVPKKEAGEYTPIPADVYTVELLDVNAREVETYDSKKARKSDDTLAPKMEMIFDFQFVLLEGKDGDKDLRGRSLFANYIPSYLYIGKNGKNSLYQIVEALQRQSISPDQEAFGITGKELNMLVGKQCRVVTVNKEVGDKTYSNIDNYMQMKEAYPSLTVEEKEKSRIKPKDGEKSDSILPEYQGTDEVEIDKSGNPF